MKSSTWLIISLIGELFFFLGLERIECTGNNRVQLSCIPPTSAAAFQHLSRVFYQVQIWLGNELDPENWGWVLKEENLEPIQTLLGPAPEKLLNTIFCNCKIGCNSNCSCKKVGLYCSQICSNCQGQSCSNVEPNTTQDDGSDLPNQESNVDTQDEEI